MNKIKLLALSALSVFALGLVSCDTVEESLSQPASNPQLPMFDASNLAVNTPSGATFDLQKLNDTNADAQVSSFTLAEFPDMYQLQLVMQIAKDNTFGKVYEVPATVDADGHVMVSPDALQGVYYANFSHSPEIGTMFVRYIANAVYDKETVRIGGADTYYGQGEILVKPFAPGHIIERDYYMVGTVSDGTIAQAVKLDHSDINQYDDPIFTIQVDITTEMAENGFEWYLVPASTFAAGKVDGEGTAFGPKINFDGDVKGSLTGEFEAGEPHMGIYFEEGPHLFSFNMADMTYEISLAIEEVYAYGASVSIGYLLPTTDYVHYRGFYGARQAFFCLANGNTIATANMRWGQATDDSGNAIEGSIALQEAPVRVELPHVGCYFIDANLVTLTYTASPIESFGLIGGFNGWGADVEMTHTDKNYMVWTAELTIDKGTEFKIRTNGSWDGVNLGCVYGDQQNMGTLVEHGENIIWPYESGTYQVTLDLTQVPYSLTAVAK